MQRGMGMSGAPPAGVQAARQMAASAATESVPQSIAQGEDATRRHIASGIKAGDVDPVTGKKILYYHDPMVPGNKFDKPGKSPFMDMMLVPVYADSDGDQRNVTVSPRIQQNLGVRTAPVTEGTLSPQVSAVGSIAFNERDQAIVQARATGYVERLHVRATLDRVAKGQPLVELYVPGLDRGAGRVLVGAPHAGHRPRAAGRRRAPAHAPGRHERRRRSGSSRAAARRSRASRSSRRSAASSSS